MTRLLMDKQINRNSGSSIECAHLPHRRKLWAQSERRRRGWGCHQLPAGRPGLERALPRFLLLHLRADPSTQKHISPRPRVIALEMTCDLMTSHKSCGVQWKWHIPGEVSQCGGLLKAGHFSWWLSCNIFPWKSHWQITLSGYRDGLKYGHQ